MASELKTPGLESYSVLVVSSAHVTEEDMTKLQKRATGTEGMVFSRDSGVIIKLYEPELGEQLNQKGTYSWELNNIIQYAETNGYRMIEIDCDCRPSSFFTCA